MAQESSITISGLHYQTGQPITVCVENGRIASIEPLSGPEAPTAALWIAPGLVDLQVNGYAGNDFNTLPLAPDTLIQATRALWAMGVTAYLPTIITNSDTAITELAASIESARRASPLVHDTVRGIHLEGPFISPIDGPRGAHDARFVKRPDWTRFQRWQQASGGSIRLVTLSPEWDDGPEFIRKCVASGVKVAIGHTAASTHRIAEAVASGATLSTHLGNGAHPVLPRHPNYIWDQLADDGLWASMIADGFHLPDSVLRVFLKVKQDKLMLVSDSVFLSGMRPGRYTTHVGGEVELTESGKLHLAGHSELLAGSVQPVLNGVVHLVTSGLAEFGDAWDMASVRPSIYLGLETAVGLAVGAPADLAVVRRDGPDISIAKVYKRGTLVYNAGAVTA